MSTRKARLLNRIENGLEIILVVLLVFSLATGDAAAGAVEEPTRNQGATEKRLVLQDYKDNSEATGPRIKLMGAMSSSNDVNLANLTIQIIAPGDASINHDSIRIRYGLLRIDVTEKIRHRVDLSGNAIELSSATLPLGTHRLSIEISDTKNRKSAIRLRFKVVDSAIQV